jgi:hypothetical protein
MDIVLFVIETIDCLLDGECGNPREHQSSRDGSTSGQSVQTTRWTASSLVDAIVSYPQLADINPCEPDYFAITQPDSYACGGGGGVRSNPTGGSALQGRSTWPQPQQGALARIRSNVSRLWSRNDYDRGHKIETALGGNLQSNFPTIDRFSNGIATSIKSMDITKPSLQNPVSRITSMANGYASVLSRFRGGEKGMLEISPQAIIDRELIIAVPSIGTQAQMNAMQATVNYGASLTPPVRVYWVIVE